MGEDVDELCFGFFLRCIFEVWLYLIGDGALGALAHNSYAIGNQAGADSPVLLTLP